MSDILQRLTLSNVLAERDALRAEAASAQVSYAILRTILTQGYTAATGDAKVAADVPLIDLARAVCDSLGTLRAERDAEAAGRDDLVRRLNLATETARQSDRSLYAVRHLLDSVDVPPPGDSLARRLHEVIATHAGYAADLRDERNALRTILDGRTTMPTLAEIEAHSKAHGGRWLVQGGTVEMHVAPRSTARLSVWPDAADAPYEDEGAETWLAECAGVRVLPIDGDDRPCAWPTVTS